MKKELPQIVGENVHVFNKDVDNPQEKDKFGNKPYILPLNKPQIVQIF